MFSMAGLASSERGLRQLFRSTAAQRAYPGVQGIEDVGSLRIVRSYRILCEGPRVVRKPCRATGDADAGGSTHPRTEAAPRPTSGGELGWRGSSSA